MPRVCSKCQSNKYLESGKKFCIKCRALDLENRYNERYNKAPKFAATYLFEEYYLMKKSLREVALKNECTSQNVHYWLIVYDIPIRSIKEAKSNTFNSYYFKKLNSNSAFLLGYFFSDGDLLYHKDKGYYFLRIYSKYKGNIELVKRQLETNAKIQYRKSKLNDKERKGAVYFLHIADQEIVKDLMELGMVYNKNQSIQYPKIPERLNRHFIRGLWAGSGAVFINKPHNLNSKLVIGSIDLITEVERILTLNGLKKRTIYTNKGSKKPSYYITYSIQESKKLLKYLYTNTTENNIEKHQYETYRAYFKTKR